jgi:hypothetical protein
MSYWGTDIHDNDFAFDAVGVIVLLIKEKMLADIKAVKSANYPEQSIASSLACLRVIGERFPKCLSVHFRKRDFEAAQMEFYQWLESEAKIPPDLKQGIRQSAEVEFRLFQERVLNSCEQC